jgi:hypothetical protein
VYGYVPGSFDAKLHLVAAYAHHGYLDIVANHDAFVDLARQYQHRESLPGPRPFTESVANPNYRLPGYKPWGDR